MKESLKTTAIATAVAALFSANAAFAGIPAKASKDPSKKVSAGDKGKGKGAKVMCKGINECKGKGACKAGEGGCKGKNSCKGKGITAVGSEKDCTDKNGTVEK